MYGRFVAEEGSFYFKNSYENSVLYGLFQIHFGGSYLNFWANICTVLATIPKLEYAPLVTVYLNLILKIFFIYFIFKSDSLILKNFLYKYLFALILIASPSNVPEVWLNSINAQSYFGLFTIILFFTDFSKKNYIHKYSTYILILSGLTSLYSCVLTPFFYFKYKFYKNKFDLRNFFALLATTIIQGSILIYSKLNNLAWSVRHELSFEKIINFYYNVIVKSIVGRENAHLIIDLVKSIDMKILFLLFSFLLLILIFFLFSYFYKKKDKIFYFLFCFFIAESVLILIGSHYDQAGGRYAVVPGIIILLIIIKLAQENSKLLKISSFFLIFLSISSGLYEFKNRNINKNFLLCNDCPVWKEEIKIWRSNPNYKIKIWNYPGELMKLN